LNCTEVCPKGISPTRAIKYIQRVGITRLDETPAPAGEAPGEDVPLEVATAEAGMKIDRATFLRHAGVAALGAAAVLTLGGVAAVTTVGAVSAETKERWLPLARLADLPAGQVTTVLLNYELQSGIYTQTISKPVLISRQGEELICYKSACPHLGCIVHWDGSADQYRCACHGGAFDESGKVVAGPPPRPLDQYQTRIEGDQVFVLV
jgi:succinate dehydrogenase / fumarate reductase iron-sulfur subunit